MGIHPGRKRLDKGSSKGHMGGGKGPKFMSFYLGLEAEIPMCSAA